MDRVSRESEGVFVPTILEALANVHQLSIAEQACGGTVPSDLALPVSGENEEVDGGW